MIEMFNYNSAKMERLTVGSILVLIDQMKYDDVELLKSKLNKKFTASEMFQLMESNMDEFQKDDLINLIITYYADGKIFKISSIGCGQLIHIFAKDEEEAIEKFINKFDLFEDPVKDGYCRICDVHEEDHFHSYSEKMNWNIELVRMRNYIENINLEF